jgi:hypothetical protein
MDWEKDLAGSSTDEREARFVESARLISQLQAGLIEDLDWFDTAQAFTADGARSLSEWVAQKLDVSADTARGLVRTMRRTQNKPHLREALAAGMVSFDRAEALSRIEDEKDLLQHLDIAGVYRTAADRVEITTEDEIRSAEDQYLIMQPSLDESWWQIRGGFDGLTGALIDQALTEKADHLPELPDGTTGSLGWRRAIALYELASGGQTTTAQVTVFVNAEQAVPTNGRAGVRLEAGPRVGPQALEAILCDASTEVTINTADGIPMKYGRSSRPVPPALKRAMMNTTGGCCGIDGCSSRYRVEVHHKTPYSQGGGTNPENLLPLCWFHHHIVIHQRGFQLFRHPEHGRWRLRKPEPQSDSTKPKG